jgi:hypothetical protein
VDRKRRDGLLVGRTCIDSVEARPIRFESY